MTRYHAMTPISQHEPQSHKNIYNDLFDDMVIGLDNVVDADMRSVVAEFDLYNTAPYWPQLNVNILEWWEVRSTLLRLLVLSLITSIKAKCPHLSYYIPDGNRLLAHPGIISSM